MGVRVRVRVRVRLGLKVRVRVRVRVKTHCITCCTRRGGISCIGSSGVPVVHLSSKTQKHQHRTQDKEEKYRVFMTKEKTRYERQKRKNPV